MTTTRRAPVLTLAATAAALAVVLWAPNATAQGLRPSGGGAAPSGGGMAVPRSAAPLPPLPPLAPSTTSASSLPQQADHIVAVVNSEPVTNNEVRARVGRAMQQYAQQGVLPPNASALARLALERLISEKAQVQEARERGIKVDDVAIDQAEQTVARQNQMEVSEMRRRLAVGGATQADFRNELRSQLLIQRLREREVDARVTVSELDIDQYLREQQQQPANAAAGEINLGHVLVRVPENAAPSDVATLQAKAQKVADRARAGDDIAVLARDFSDAAERSSGGLLGMRPMDRYPPLFVDATARLEVGGVAGPLRSPAGFHVLKVVEKRVAGQAGSVVPQTQARHILLRVSPQLSERQAVDRLAEYKRRLQAGQADFASLAKEHSQDASAKDGGELGWANPGQFVPEFEEALTNLAAGETSDPVITRFGVHLIQLAGRRETQLTPREQRELVRAVVREKKLDEAYATWAQELRGRAYVEFREPPGL